MEEAHAAVQDLKLFSFFDIPVIGQAYMIFRCACWPVDCSSAGPPAA